MQTILSSLFVLFFCMGFSSVQAQFEFPPLSYQSKITQRVGHATIGIDYERPSARERVIFGDLVPWAEVWRTGASWCTKISFSHPVSVGKQRVPAGTYSLFTIPNPNQWMVIFNRDTSLYGAYDYSPEKDVARFQVKPVKSSRYYETFTIDIDVVPNDAVIYLSWANTQISFPVATGTDAAVMDFISESLMTDKEEKDDPYLSAADYLLFTNTNFYDAIHLGQKAQAIEKSDFAYWVQKEAYEKLEFYDKALAIAEEALAWQETRQFANEADKKAEVESWEKEVRRLKKKIKATD
jgi:hypothetical protein